MVLNSKMKYQKCEGQNDEWKTRNLTFTSTCPLKAAWCSAVLPARSDTFTLLRRGTKASAHFTALFAAAMCRGVCQFLSRALTSAECFNNTWTASWKHLQKKKPSHLVRSEMTAWDLRTVQWKTTLYHLFICKHNHLDTLGFVLYHKSRLVGTLKDVNNLIKSTISRSFIP